MSIATIDRPPRPAASYAAALERVRVLEQADASSPFPLNPVSHTRLLLPAGGGPTRRVLVCFHGLTNGPQSFVPLTEPFVAQGDTVLIPRLPRHGYADRLNTDLEHLTADALLDAAAEAVDLAAGLAGEVVVVGISLGGVLAAWAAQFRPVARVVIIAPSIGLPFIPGWLNRLLISAALRLPNRYLWWDPRAGADLPGPPYAYPRFATHVLAHVQRLGFHLVERARRASPAAAETWAVTNAADVAVNNRTVATLVRHWRQAPPVGPPGAWPGRVECFCFPRRLRLFHDIVDPLQPYQNVALTHPVLRQIIGSGRAPEPGSLQPPAPR